MTVTVSSEAQVRNYLPAVAEALIVLQGEINTELAALGASANALDWKNAAKAATTAALPANTRAGNVLTANANGALGAQDGVTLIVPNRLLVKDEATQANNGLYVVTSLGAAGAPWVLTRTTDADESAEVSPGLMVSVEQGSIYGDKVFVLDIAGPVTLNTTALVFSDWRGLAVTAPTDVTKAAAVVGTSLTLARSDHKHDVSTAVVGAVAIGDAAAEGVATSLARSDHAHSVTGGTPVAIGSANADGAAVTFARSNHVHDHGAQTVDTQHALAVAGVSHGFISSTNQAKIDSIQGGTATLGAGGTVTVAATITASSRIPMPSITAPGAGAITGFAGFTITNKVVGAPGSFDITAIDDAKAAIATAVCVVDWIVVG